MFNNISCKALKQTLILFVAIFFSMHSANAAADGKALFQANCASCHNPYKDLTGPALNGVSGRTPGKEWLYKWIHNSSALIASGDKYANEIYTKWNKVAMTSFPSLSTEEIDAIITYVEAPPPAAAAPAAGMATGAATTQDASANNFFYFIITALLAIVAIVLTQVNRKMGKLATERQGLPVREDVPFYKNKLYIAVAAVLGIIAFGSWMINSGVKLGRSEGYEPSQEIFYSHKVHAGINQINCQYCHSGAEKSKHSMIPSTNVCMNCHKAINEYTGAEEHPLITAEGKTVDGTAEIQKLYKYAGWDPIKKAYNRDAAGNILAKPIPWTKIHNLPDHVAFNHNTHVKSGQVPCQRCHGPVQEMDEVYQFSDLSMGFCINCHRETKVQFTDNKYYSIFQKYHDEIKAGTREKGDVKVSEVGGLECAKCHY
jgi:mono/diheme cytochrome c family protein